MTSYPSCLVEGICAAIHAARPARGARFVAIDGPGCAGKTPLAGLVQHKLGGTAITVGLDDFFVPLAQQPAGWNPDEDISEGVPHLRWQQVEDVLTRIRDGQASGYRPYLWDQDVLGPKVVIPPRPIVVVEGLYALHQRLRHLYSFKIWIDVRRDSRVSRVETRDGTRLVSQWHERYIPREWAYLATQRPFDHADVFVLGADLDWSSSQFCFSRQACGVSPNPPFDTDEPN